MRSFSQIQRKSTPSSAIHPLDWLKKAPCYPKLYWKQGDLEIALSGALLHFDALPLELPNPPLRLWGGHSFFKQQHLEGIWSKFPSSYFFLPRYELVYQKKEATLYTHFFEKEPSSFSDTPCKTSEEALFSFLSHTPTQEHWSELIEKAQETFARTSLQKVVLARSSTYKSSSLIDPFSLFDDPLRSSSLLTLFLFQPSEAVSFVGASPEKLYSRKERALQSVALAGTRKRGSTLEEDLDLELELLSDRKELYEFALVKESIIEALSPLCEEKISFPSDLTVLKTAHVQHLYHPLHALLKETTSDLDLLKALHPTAALGGFPKRQSGDFIQRYESIERGWYGAPLGYCNQSHSEFIVAIRSLLIDLDLAHLFVGAGIVADSFPAKEWLELENKAKGWVQRLHGYCPC